MEFLDPESYQIREVFAHFGLAVHNAQALERTLAIAMATVYGPGPNKTTRKEYDSLLESNFQRTLGRLIGQIKRTVKVSPEIDGMLSDALGKRNWLVHDYFWERAVPFAKNDGRQSMLKELKEIADFFEEVDAQFMAIVHQWGEKHGITKEIREEELRKMMNGT